MNCRFCQNQKRPFLAYVLQPFCSLPPRFDNKTPFGKMATANFRNDSLEIYNDRNI